jgi:hypothetical protein
MRAKSRWAQWLTAAAIVLALILVFNLDSAVLLADLGRGGVTVLALKGAALPVVNDGVEVQLTHLTFPSFLVSVPSGDLKLSGRLVRVGKPDEPDDGFPAELTFFITQKRGTTVLGRHTFKLEVEKDGQIDQQSFHVAADNILPGDLLALSMMPKGGGLPLSRLNINVQLKP